MSDKKVDYRPTRQAMRTEFNADRYRDRSTAWVVIVTGSRRLRNKRKVHKALEDELAHARNIGLPMVVREGQCPYGGADRIAEEWAKATEGVIHEPFPADWATHGRAAGRIRNQEMVNAGADVCLAFPLSGSRGTWDCVEKAERAQIPVVVIR